MYNILLLFIKLLSNLSFLWPKKYQVWFSEQKKIFDQFKKTNQKSIWIHCASLGEYESIRPLIRELIKSDSLINVTFFSSSGYINFYDFDIVNKISYLPLDTSSNMQNFIKCI